MRTFKNETGDRLDIPMLELHVADGETFEVPDEYAAQFDADPRFAVSRVKNPDQPIDPAVAAAVVAPPLTGPVPTIPAASYSPDPAPAPEPAPEPDRAA